jgi:two-component system, OmpR family, response regulator MprA
MKTKHAWNENRRPRVLIVDDEPAITRTAKAFLERIGNFQVETVNDPFAALLAALKFRPDAVLLDVNMPGADGGEVAAAFKADYLLTDIPILFLTGLVDPSGSFQQEAEIDGMQFLGKPFSPIRLIEAINRMIGRPATFACGNSSSSGFVAPSPQRALTRAA